MDGVLDERQKLCDAGIVFRALNPAYAGRENPSSLACGLYRAPQAFRKPVGEYCTVSSQGSGSNEAFERFPSCHHAGALDEGSGGAHFLAAPFRHMDAMDRLGRYSL